MTVLEACYTSAPDDRQWLEAVLSAWRPLIDSGIGVAAYFLDAACPTPRVSNVVTFGTGLSAEDILAPIEARPSAMSDRIFRYASRVGTASVASGLGDRLIEAPSWRSWFERLGMRDSLGIVALDAAYQGCVISAGRRVVGDVPRDEAALYGRLATHVTAGLRVRAKGGAPALDASDAVLSPSGKVLHAAGSATGRASRDALADGARRIDRARGRLRQRDADEAVGIWQGLVAGRWSLLDHFDHDGRRYLVAKENTPEPPSATTPLTLREWQLARYASLGYSNKLIGYELGLSASTVSTHLRHAAEKLGVTSRADVVNAFRRKNLALTPPEPVRRGR